MMKGKKKLLVLACIMLMATILTACGPSQAELDAQATEVAANIFATQTAEALTFTPTPTLTSTPTPTATPPPATPTVTPTPSPPSFSKEEVLEIESISAGVGEGEVLFIKGEEPETLRIEINGTVPVVEGKMCLGCVNTIRIGPNLKVSTDPWFIDREHEGESVTLNLALEGPYPADATEFIVSGPEGATLRKEGKGFLLVEGEAYLLQTTSY